MTRWLVLLGLAALLGGCAVEDADAGASPGTRGSGGGGGGSVAVTGNGVPIDGYPSYEERVMLVAINRGRADPNNPAAGTAHECSEWRDPLPPVVFNHDIGQAARFHCANLGLNGGGLSHATFCELRDDIEASGCDGLADCACVPGTECWTCDTLGGCGTNFGGRLTRFGFAGSAAGEVGAAGYSDAWAAVVGWITENPCNSSTLGHRNNLTSSGANVVGTGVHRGGACWQSFYFADFGRIDGLAVPALASGVHRPERGGAETSFTFYANYFDGDREPRSLHVVVGGECQSMTLEVGEPGNATYTWTGPVPEAGCVEYHFQTTTSAGRQVRYPESGSLLLEAGGDCDGQSYTTRRAGVICR